MIIQQVLKIHNTKDHSKIDFETFPAACDVCGNVLENENKLKNLQRKYRKSEEEKVDKIPEAMKNLGLEKLSVFSKERYEEKPVKQYEPEIIGEIDPHLHDNERLILMLPPKFS